MKRRNLLALRLNSLLAKVVDNPAKVHEWVRWLDATGWEFAIIGGFLRDLDIIGDSSSARDLDIVVKGPDLHSLECELTRAGIETVANRYGGLKHSKGPFSTDIWPIGQTWAFRQRLLEPTFDNLPRSTFLNVDSLVAIRQGTTFRILDNGYFEGVRTNTIEVAFSEAPSMPYVVAKTFALSARFGFAVGPQLADYILTAWSNDPLGLAARAYREHLRYYPAEPLFSERHLRFVLRSMSMVMASTRRPWCPPVIRPKNREEELMLEATLRQRKLSGATF